MDEIQEQNRKLVDTRLGQLLVSLSSGDVNKMAGIQAKTTGPRLRREEAGGGTSYTSGECHRRRSTFGAKVPRWVMGRQLGSLVCVRARMCVSC